MRHSTRIVLTTALALTAQVITHAEWKRTNERKVPKGTAFELRSHASGGADLIVYCDFGPPVVGIWMGRLYSFPNGPVAVRLKFDNALMASSPWMNLGAGNVGLTERRAGDLIARLAKAKTLQVTIGANGQFVTRFDVAGFEGCGR